MEPLRDEQPAPAPRRITCATADDGAQLLITEVPGGVRVSVTPGSMITLEPLIMVRVAAAVLDRLASPRGRQQL